MRSSQEPAVNLPLKEMSILERNSRLNHEGRTRVTVIDEVNEEEAPPVKLKRKVSSSTSVGDGSIASGSRNGSTSRRERNPYRTSRPRTLTTVPSVSGLVDNVGNKVQAGAGMVNAAYTGSASTVNQSLTTIHEQYCSCTRWSKLEKTLVIIVSVLAFMVIVLIVTVGLLADRHDDDRPWWVLFR